MALALCGIVAIAGCTSTAAPTAHPSHHEASTTAAPTSTTAPGVAASTPAATPSPSAAALTLGGNAVGTINSYEPTTPVDTGPRAMATGTVTRSSAGVPETYTVAADDDFNTIAERLGLIPGYLYTLNMVRRADLTLYVGDILNLDPSRIATVGAENGVVSDLPLPDGAPPQS